MAMSAFETFDYVYIDVDGVDLYKMCEDCRIAARLRKRTKVTIRQRCLTLPGLAHCLYRASSS